MKIGTLSCWLFGHKFVESRFSIYPEITDFLKGLTNLTSYEGRLPIHGNYHSIPTDYCVRCGIDKEKTNDQTTTN